MLGCIGGGGQPKPTNLKIRLARTKLIYAEDMKLPIRKSHDNPEVTKIYQQFYNAPLSHLSHEYLHTKYSPKPILYENFIDTTGIQEVIDHIKRKKFEPKRADLIYKMLFSELKRNN